MSDRTLVVLGEPGIGAGPPVTHTVGVSVGTRQLVDLQDGLVQPGGLAVVRVVELELRVVHVTGVVRDDDQELVHDLLIGEAGGQQLRAGVRLTGGEVRVQRGAVDAVGVEGHGGSPSAFLVGVIPCPSHRSVNYYYIIFYKKCQCMGVSLCLTENEAAVAIKGFRAIMSNRRIILKKACCSCPLFFIFAPN